MTAQYTHIRKTEWDCGNLRELSWEHIGVNTIPDGYWWVIGGTYVGQGRGLTNQVWHKGRGHESIRSDVGLSARLQAFQLTLLSSSTTLPTCQLSVSSPPTSEGTSGLVGVVVPLLILKLWTSWYIQIRLVHGSRLRSAHTSSLVTVTKYWL